jgi:ABC-type bacteriocin/lantibiotic exporter with double-glycine peptidase domain
MYGKNISETDVAIALKTGMTGTTDQEAAIGAKLLGFPDAAPCRPTLAEMLAEDLPLIVTIECDGVMHDVGLVGAASHTVIIADPLVGLVHYTHADFQAVYQKRGVKLGRPVFSQENPVRLSTFKPELFQKVIAPAGG